MKTALERLLHQEQWIEKQGVENIEFSHLLDLFRDERKLIREALTEAELKGFKAAKQREAAIMIKKGLKDKCIKMGMERAVKLLEKNKCCPGGWKTLKRMIDEK